MSADAWSIHLAPARQEDELVDEIAELSSEMEGIVLSSGTAVQLGLVDGCPAVIITDTSGDVLALVADGGAAHVLNAAHDRPDSFGLVDIVDAEAA